MKVAKLMIILLFALGLFFLPTIAGASAKQDDKPEEPKPEESVCDNAGFNFECSCFYNNSNYYTIEKWSVKDGDNDYTMDEESSVYSYYNIDVTGNLKEADWTSAPNVESVLVKAGNERVAFDGGASGEVNTTKHDISHITFCGYYSGSNGGGDGGDGGNGVPEFPAFTVGAAVLVATLGLVFLRKN